LILTDTGKMEMAPGVVTGVPTGTVFNIMRYSVKDGQGLRTTVFLKGCPLSCSWCHNPESQATVRQMILRGERCIACGECVNACKEGAIVLADGVVTTFRERCMECGACSLVCHAEAREAVGEQFTVAEVMAEIRKDLPFYEESGGGVTFSGGEPLGQPDFLEALLAVCRREDIHTAVDTAGAAPWAVVERIRRHVDLFLYDLKLMDDARHRRHVGASNRLILDNLERLAAAGGRILVRMAIIPGINDDEQNLTAVGEFVRSLEGVPEITILPYHGTAPEKYRLLGRRYQLDRTVAPTPERMEEIAARLRRHGVAVSTGG
jgi:pyruvate formate lyase activating enzyme